MGNAQRLIDERLGAGIVVVTIAIDATAFDAACTMNEHRIGALVVVGDRGEVEGIFTERDLLKRVVAEGLRPEEVRVEQVMTRDVIVCRPDTDADAIRHTMREKRIRHIPVVGDSGDLLGMVSIGDLNTAEVQVMSETISYLQQYMTRL